jgi:hypothetical protein
MKSSHTTDSAFAAGMQHQLALRGVSRGELVKAAAATDELLHPRSEAFGRFCAELACQAFVKSGAALSDPTFARFTVLKNASDWSATHQRAAVAPVLEALAHTDAEMQLQKNAGDMADTVASAVSAFLPASISGATKLAPGVLKTLFGLAALGGTATGIASWHANRDAQEDDIPSEIDQSKANYYTLLTHRLREASARNPIAA